MNSAPASSPLLDDYSALVDRALVSAFLENVPDLVYFKDRDCRFIAVSQSKALRHGIADRADLAGKSDRDFFSPQRAAASQADEEEIMRTGTPIVGKLEKLIWADGRETYARTTKLPLHDECGEVIGTFGISQDMTEAKRTEDALERTRKELVDASRVAGMAEVATGVLHNVGNVLNSVNVSATLVADQVRRSKSPNVGRLSDLLHQHRADLGDYLVNDPKGKIIPAYLMSLKDELAKEQSSILAELDSLHKNIGHIKDIVAMQQSYAKTSGVVETVSIPDLIEDALRMNAGSLARHDVDVAREYLVRPVVTLEKNKALQILVNLVRNAKYACDESGRLDKLLTIRTTADAHNVNITVSDNGVGIPVENLTRIFAHGFTTRKDGHGFGLHSGALAAKELGGSLTAHSAGPGHGASFTLILPYTQEFHHE